MLKVVCIIYKYSTEVYKYHEAYALRLLSQVRRCITVPFEFHCITNIDYPEIMNESIIFHKKTYEELSDGWAKLDMLEMFNGPCLYLDLTSVLQKNIDDLLTTDADMRIVAEYWNKMRVNTSMIYWNKKYNFDGISEEIKMNYSNFNDFVAKELSYDIFPRMSIYSRAYGYDELENGLIGDLKDGLSGEYISYQMYYNKSFQVCLHNDMKKIISYNQLRELKQYWEPIPYYDD